MILLTGTTGFLGSQLLIDLLNKNYKIVALKDLFQILKEYERFLEIKSLIL